MLRRRVVVERPTKIGRFLQRLSFGGLLAGNIIGCTDKSDTKNLPEVVSVPLGPSVLDPPLEPIPPRNRT